MFFQTSWGRAQILRWGLGLIVSGCASGDPAETLPTEPSWSQAAAIPSHALMSVHGRSASDVWMVGADHGTGPVAWHWDGAVWDKLETGAIGDLWWVHAMDSGPTFFAGANANILRLQDGTLERQATPGLGKHTVYGLWAASPRDVYAVGSAAGRNGFIWHSDGGDWQALPLPLDVPVDSYRDIPGFFKVWGSSADDVWVVGGAGVVLRGNARDGFQLVSSDASKLYFTVHASKDRVVVVGSGDGGVLLESDGGALVDRTPASAPLLQGACVASDHSVWATGLGGSVYHSSASGFVAVDPGVDFDSTQSLHSAWVDPDGGFWSVGGHVLTPELDAGIAIHRGPAVPLLQVERPTISAPTCPSDAVDPVPDGSIARRWNEQALNAIRRDTPRPTVHARNLFHSSIAMWDAWAAYDAVAAGYLVRERQGAADVDAARREAISYAAYRVLTHRYGRATGGPTTRACLDAFMQKLGYDPNDSSASANTPRALGNHIGQTVIDSFASDGANEAANYADSEAYVPNTPNLVVDLPSTTATDPLRWQKLVLAQAVTQNGIAQGAGPQDYIGSQWGQVVPFSLVRPSNGASYLDIGSPPSVLDDALVEASVEVIRKTAELDIDDGALIDISPGAYGNNPLASNDGKGRPQNPNTGKPYEKQLVKRGDFARVLAEFWADGPKSETPPGHWNTLANTVADAAGSSHKLSGTGPQLDALAWDVHVYLALNGALHDAAIAAWELKRKYTAARPITLIRYMAQLGQRTDANAASFNPGGLPLVAGLIEVITEQSAAPGERHAHLARYVGEIAVRSWRGEPGDRKHEHGGVGWIRAAEWTPYQRRTFVTPAFPGYVSGHSTFSRAAATVLAELTGSEFFPGGLGTFSCKPGYLVFEQGPSAPVQLQWATYYDAADQAGQSRVFGGIHIRHDDFDGRRIGARVGSSAVKRAQQYFDGVLPP